MTAEPWQKFEVPGTRKASLITKPEVVLAMVKKAKKPVLIVGHQAIEVDLGEKKPIDYAIRIAKAGNIPVVATAQTVAEFLKRNFKPATWMSAMDIGGRLVDSSWNVEGKEAPHDLVLVLGIPYSMAWLIESGLKTFAPHLKTISLDRFYQPHCNWSFPNLSLEDWARNLEKIARGLEG